VTEVLATSNSCFGALDGELRRITEYCLPETYSGNSDSWTRRSQLSIRGLGATITDAVQIKDNRPATIGFFTKGRIAIFDSTGNHQGMIGSTPPGDKKVPIPVRQHAYQGFMAYRHQSDQIVVGTRHADFIEIYASDEGRSSLTHGPRQFVPIYDWEMKGNTPGMIQVPEMRFGYVNVEIAGNRIYALYSGDTQSEDNGLAYMGSELLIFDLEGRPVRHYTLDREIISIEVSKSGSVVYASVLHPKPLIVRYRLPSTDSGSSE